MTNNKLKAPFPYFGGKSRASELIWSRLGADDLGNYVEPFLGSAAVYLNRPKEFSGWSALNDIDGNVVNFWRSIRLHPERTAQAASQPVFEADLHARHLRLVNGGQVMAQRLMADTEYCEPELAGWWAWGACVWIGGGWCSGVGPWNSVPDNEGIPILCKNGGKGVNRQLPHLSDRGNGVNRKLPHLGDGGTIRITDKRLLWIQDWFAVLQDSFRDARITCGDWNRICSSGTMTLNGVCGVLLDPPYSQTNPVYAHDSRTVAHDVRKWCIENGQNPKLRIALCGHDGEHNELTENGWKVETWVKGGGYQGKDNRERIWFSPYCLFKKEQNNLI